jgi:hypothetical protein
MSIREGVMPVEEKIDLNDINKKVDGKIKDLLHNPSKEHVFDDLTHDSEGKPQAVHQLKAMVDNEGYLRDLIFDDVQVHRFNQECDNIAE